MKLLQVSLLPLLLLVGQVANLETLELVELDDSSEEDQEDGACVYRGVYYSPGERVPHWDKCAMCRCAEGSVSCLMTMCALPRCVDPVEGEVSCCMTCPNGPNCMSPYGIMAVNDEPKRVPYGEYCTAICRCHRSTRSFYRRHAQCSLSCEYPEEEWTRSNEYDRSDEDDSSEESRSSSSESDESAE